MKLVRVGPKRMAVVGPVVVAIPSGISSRNQATHRHRRMSVPQGTLSAKSHRDGVSGMVLLEAGSASCRSDDLRAKSSAITAFCCRTVEKSKYCFWVKCGSPELPRTLARKPKTQDHAARRS